MPGFEQLALIPFEDVPPLRTSRHHPSWRPPYRAITLLFDGDHAAQNQGGERQEWYVKAPNELGRVGFILVDDRMERDPNWTLPDHLGYLDEE